MLVIKQFTAAIDFHSMEKNIIEFTGYPSTIWSPTISKISFFCVQQKKLIHTDLEQVEDE